MELPPVLVVGAGVIGLSTAIRLREKGHPVTVWAKRFSPWTTSDVSAAIWYPYKAAPEDKVQQWGIHSLAEFVRLAEVKESGVFLCPGEKYFYRPMGNPWWADKVPAFRRLAPSELSEGQRDGFAFTLPVADMSNYMPYLRRRFESLGGVLLQRDIEDFEEALAHCPTVVNCTGLGAKELTGDLDLFPIRGVVVEVEKLETARFVMATDHPKGMVYVIPRRNSCILGGIAEDHAWRDTPGADECEAIHARCEEVMPELKGKKILRQKAGLRPGREAIRLEVVSKAGGTIIHNYGHGGSGMTLSWGCANEVLNYV